MYLLFFSKQCKYSVKFIELLRKINEIEFFNCVEVVKIKGRYPELVYKYNIKEVPTIIVNGEMMVGNNAFRWVKSKIKNLNYSISSQDTRVNKTPVVSGYSSSSFNTPIDSSKYSSINTVSKIETPEEGTEIEKSTFVLAPDNITNGQKIEDSREDKNSKLERDYKKMLDERKL